VFVYNESGWSLIQGCPYFDTLTETQVATDLSDYDVLILPAIRIGYADEVVAALGADGLTAIRGFVEGGGFLSH